MNEVKKDDEDSEDGEEEDGTAAVRENDEISRKDVEIRRLIELRRSTLKEEKQRVKELSKSTKKCIRDKEKSEKTTRNPKNSRRLQRCQQHPKNQTCKEEWSLRRLRMKEEKSSHHIKKDRQCLRWILQKTLRRQKAWRNGNESNIDVHISDTEEMTREPEITSEELQEAIRKLEKGKSPDSEGIQAADIKACGDRSSTKSKIKMN